MIAEMTPVWVGLDYHQGSIQVCVLDSNGKVRGNRRCGNDVTEVVEFIQQRGEPQAIAIESCTGAAEFGDELRGSTGWPVKLAHPGYVSRMKMNPDKTDFADARLLSDLVRAGYLPEVWLAPRYIRELRTLVRHRQALIDQRKATKLRIRALMRTRRIKPPQGLRSWTKGWLSWLTDEVCSETDRWVIDDLLDLHRQLTERIKRAEKQLVFVTEADPVVAQLMHLPCVGRVTAWVFRAEIADFSRFKNGKQLARFCGVTPRNVSSGERVADSGLIKAGNPQLKTIIMQAAHRLLRCSSRWQAFGERLARAGKPTCVIVAAVGNRWIRGLSHELKQMTEVHQAA